jgi:hypothetical protein
VKLGVSLESLSLLKFSKYYLHLKVPAEVLETRKSDMSSDKIEYFVHYENCNVINTALNQLPIKRFLI